MPDMLVKLYELAPIQPELDAMQAKGVTIRRARAYEISKVCEFIANNFAKSWADEVSVGFANKPTSVFIAIREGRLVGFGAYECTCRGFFGPTGVLDSERGHGVGKALLLACLDGLKQAGYAYAIIGGVGPASFYEKACNAVLIPDSSPGIYGQPLAKE